MVFPGLVPAAIARALAQVAGDGEESAEVYCERRLDAELPPEGAQVGLRVRREEGLAVRLTRGTRGWIASRDALDGRALAEALRQVARVGPAAAVEPEFAVGPSPVEVPRAELLAFPGRLEGELRRRLAAFPLRLTVRSHRRDLQVVGARVVPPAEREAFFSLDAELPWGSCGELATTLGDEVAAAFAARLVARFRAREARPPEAGRAPLVLAPAAAAVALHEAVAHALEADLLARSGHPDAGVGLELGGAALSVIDDPASAPTGVERVTDDEGVPVVRRWLLRDGRVEQPLADAVAARRWPVLLPGAGFRAGRHGRVRPRTSHLELLAGKASDAELAAAAEGGLWISEIASGALDPASGRFALEVPAARRIAGGEAGEPVGRFRIEGRVADLLAGVVAVGATCAAAGAGWCAKGGERRPVWARAPALAVVGLEVRP
jgi:predicted Zn-dependent protease